MNTAPNLFASFFLYLSLCMPVLSGAAENATTSEAALHGFPALYDLHGAKIADGEFVQWIENDLLHVTISYDFADGRRVEEKTSFRQNPRLIQEEWSWSESRGEELLRHFQVDFHSGKATAEKREGKNGKRSTEDLKVEPGRTFAGFGFVLAIKSIRERLVKGEKVELEAVGFTPKPRVVSVDLSYGGLDQMKMASRIVKGDRFVIHPKIPAIAKPFIEVKDTRIWLALPPAVTFLRWEGGIVETDDPLIRVDLLPADHSTPAEPASTPKTQ